MRQCLHHVDDPQVSLCAQLCSPCIRVGLGSITRWDWEEMRSMTAAAPTAWSAWVRLVAAACHERRGSPAPPQGEEERHGLSH